MKRLVDLLACGRHEDYPTEYLLARLRARKEVFAERCEKDPGEEVWQKLYREYRWMYWQMNMKLRQDLAPVFFFFELRTLFACFRFKESEDWGGINSTLQASMLCGRLQGILRKQDDLPVALKEMETILAPHFTGIAQLEDVYGNGGLAGLERLFFEMFETNINRQRVPGEINYFLTRLLERRKLLLIAKGDRWQLEGEVLPTEEKGARRRLYRIYDGLLKKEPEIGGDPRLLDGLLLRIIKKEYRRLGRTATTYNQILAYLWYCYLGARDFGVQGLASLLGEEKTLAEMVR